MAKGGTSGTSFANVFKGMPATVGQVSDTPSAPMPVLYGHTERAEILLNIFYIPAQHATHWTDWTDWVAVWQAETN